MTKYLGESFTIKATFKDEDGNLFDPTTHLITLKNPGKVTINTSTTPNKIRTGVYRTTVTIPAKGVPGVWSLWWMVVAPDGDADMEKHQFKVKTPSD